MIKPSLKRNIREIKNHIIHSGQTNEQPNYLQDIKIYQIQPNQHNIENVILHHLQIKQIPLNPIYKITKKHIKKNSLGLTEINFNLTEAIQLNHTINNFNQKSNTKSVLSKSKSTQNLQKKSVGKEEEQWHSHQQKCKKIRQRQYIVSLRADLRSLNILRKRLVNETYSRLFKTTRSMTLDWKK